MTYLAFKHERLVPEWSRLDPKLVELLEDARGVAREVLSLRFFVVTSLFREGDPGVHGTTPVRGADVQSRNNDGSQFVQVLGEGFAKEVNARWRYDPARPEFVVCLYHDAGSGFHFHFQVHARTERRFS